MQHTGIDIIFNDFCDVTTPPGSASKINVFGARMHKFGSANVNSVGHTIRSYVRAMYILVDDFLNSPHLSNGRCIDNGTEKLEVDMLGNERVDCTQRKI